MSAVGVPKSIDDVRPVPPFAAPGPQMSAAAAPRAINISVAEELEQLYVEFAPLVYRTAWGVLGSREDAEDVVQTVFMALVRRESPLELRNPKAYLCKAAMTASLNVLRAKRRRPVLVDDAGLVEMPASNRGSSFDEDLYERLSRAMDELSAESAAVLLLRYLHDKSLAEIATELGLSRTAVAVRLFRSRARLRALLHVPPEKQ
jgi:RNA polymerase sigma-70 factor (ECF subfamily)